MTPEAFAQAGQVILAFGMVRALYGAFAALAQTDLKKMIAYTSLNHMGYVVIGVAVAALSVDPRTLDDMRGFGRKRPFLGDGNCDTPALAHRNPAAVRLCRQGLSVHCRS
jgi:formate hydrogenlyase subunit 3/multisubunit Na+/H+ antiporter MnhD subunit